ncbi:hypothetical protein C5D50_01600 [Rathayibacter sp. RFBD1]|nr:hypothetical protein C5D50_01600 [Rathayibacter sp. RFBD1]PPI63193.1 hypothetical protein C5D38_01585 [Rathayibacter sp. TRS19]
MVLLVVEGMFCPFPQLWVSGGRGAIRVQAVGCKASDVPRASRVETIFYRVPGKVKDPGQLRCARH